MKICPVCNNIIEPNFLCKSCKTTLEDKGRVEEYYGPYSADMPIENEKYCTHIYKCRLCSKIENYNIKMVNY